MLSIPGELLPRRRLAAVVLVLAFPAAAALGGCTSSPSSLSGQTTRTDAPPTAPRSQAPGSTSTVPPTTTTTSPPGPPNLALGSSGPAVLALQQQLQALGYWLEAADGVFGDSTTQAVYALQKAAGIVPDGVVGPITEAALAKGVTSTPRSTSGSMIEVDLEHGLLMVVSNGHLEDTFNTSTGGGYWYTDQGVTSLAQTPTGQFTIYRQVDGTDVSPLGQLWRPKYFTGGFAIHGDSYVPPEPVSHGCVRVSNEAMDWIWANDVMPIGSAVWVY